MGSKMVDPKYANLPGIAYDQPDLYESTDLPESEQHIEFTEAEEENVGIERVHLDAEKASKSFQGKYLDGSRWDFSDPLAGPRRKGYDATTVWEIVPAGEKETQMQKFLRLKCEVQELLEEVKSEGVKGVSEAEESIKTEDFLNDIVNLQHKLGNLKIESESSMPKSEGLAVQKKIESALVTISKEQKKSQSSEPVDPSQALQYELCVSSSINDSGQKGRIGKLERRIQQLETTLGSENTDILSKSSLSLQNRSVLGYLNVLNTKFNLLDPSHIELVENRLSSVLQKLIKISDRKVDVQELERSLKLSDLYDLMESSSEIITALPELVNRFKALRELHQSAEHYARDLREVKCLQEAVANGTLNNEKILNSLQTELNALLETAQISPKG